MASQLLLVVQLSSERARQAARQDCSFANKQEPAPALLVVVRCGRLGLGTETLASRRKQDWRARRTDLGDGDRRNLRRRVRRCSRRRLQYFSTGVGDAGSLTACFGANLRGPDGVKQQLDPVTPEPPHPEGDY
jgi:hypothetical protein